jgi:predicted histidine transporter YuiF (NhaC family)
MPTGVYDPATDEEKSLAADKLATLTQSQVALMVQGVAAGYKIARGVHTQIAASDTVVTGLAAVIAVAVGFSDAPTVKQLFCAGSIGDQAGAPAAGSILINTYKPTAVNDVTPTAATDFTDNLEIAWLAIGT